MHPAFELGGYNRSPEQTPPAAIVALSVGSVNSCAILALGRVVCWGSNSDGQLGSFIGTTLFVGDSAARSMATAPIPVFFGKYFPITTFRLPDCPYEADTFLLIVPAAIKRIPLPPGERGVNTRALVERELALHRHLNQNSNRVTFLLGQHLEAGDAVFTAMVRAFPNHHIPPLRLPIRD